jgi:acetyl-CoA carboxylase biotin carboxyl carrier protein
LDIKEIKQIVDMMKRSDLTEFEIEEKDLKLRICRESGKAPPPVYGGSASPFPMIQSGGPVPAQAPPSSPPGPQGQAAGAPEEDPGDYILSPMVGTFYRAPSPESPPFIDDGGRVEPDTVVCIIEAMKVMNEIHAETRGMVTEALVQNGDPVEYGQKLFKVKPA